MAISKKLLAMQIAHAEQGFKDFSDMSLEELRAGYHRQNELIARYKTSDLLKLREKTFSSYEISS